MPGKELKIVFRRRIVIGAAAALALLAGAVVTQAQFSDPGKPPPKGDEPADAKKAYKALNRADAAAPDANYEAKLKKGLPKVNPDVDPESLRLIHRKAGVDLYAAAGSQTVCVATRKYDDAGGAIGSVGCGLATDDATGHTVHASVMIDVGDRYVVSALVPDGIDDFRVAYVDGSEDSIAVENNAVVVESAKKPRVAHWTAPDGTRGTVGLELPDSSGQPTAP